MNIFSEICVGQSVQNFLIRLAKRRDFVHAYLFIGPKGTNKNITADFFSQIIFCGENSKKEIVPCNQCEHCRQVKLGIHPDLYILKKNADSKNITIEQIRELIQRLSLRSMSAQHKVVIVHEAETMNEEAANALLKSLEEPAGNTIFILTAEHKDFLPATVVSRCQIVQFAHIGKKELTNYLLIKKLNSEQIENIYRITQGLPSLIDEYLKNEDFWLAENENVKSKLLLYSQTLDKKFAFIKKEITTKKFFTERSLLTNKELDIWTRVFRDVLLIKIGLTTQIRYQELRVSLEKFARHFTSQEIKNVLERMNDLRNLNQANLNSQLALENLYLNII